MSPLPNGTDGYTNGVSHYHPTYRDAAPARTGREHRPGGYGGFESADGNLAVPQDSDDAQSTSIDERSTGTDPAYGTARHAFSNRSQPAWQHPGSLALRDGPRDFSATYGIGQGGRQIEGKNTEKVQAKANWLRLAFRCSQTHQRQMGNHGHRRMHSRSRRPAIDGSQLLRSGPRLPGFSEDEPASAESPKVHRQWYSPTCTMR